MTNDTYKVCTICKQELTLNNFNKDKTKKDDYSNRCKECFAKYKAKWQENNRDKARLHNKVNYAKTKGITLEEQTNINIKTLETALINKSIQEDKRKQLETKQTLNQEQINSDTKVCNKCNKEKPKIEFYKQSRNLDGYDSRCKECEKLRLREERGYALTKAKTEEEKKIRKKLQKHKRRFIEQQGKIRPREVRELYLKQEAKCYWCSDDISKEYHIDHYEPLSKGGEHTIDNVVLACPTCNIKKSNRSPYEYANSIGRLL